MANEKLCKDKNGVITSDKRIAHGVWFDMIFIQLATCFQTPRLGSRIENT